MAAFCETGILVRRLSVYAHPRLVARQDDACSFRCAVQNRVQRGTAGVAGRAGGGQLLCAAPAGRGAFSCCSCATYDAGCRDGCRSLQLQRTNCRFVQPHTHTPCPGSAGRPETCWRSFHCLICLLADFVRLLAGALLALLTCRFSSPATLLLTLKSTGNTYSIRNVGSGTARVFFAQARETVPGE
jgi:hypothetical protein